MNLNAIAYYFATLVNFVVTLGTLLFCALAALLVLSLAWRAAHPRRDAKHLAIYSVLAIIAGASRIPAFDFLDEHNQAKTLVSVLVNAATVAVIVTAHWVSERVEIEEGTK